MSCLLKFLGLDPEYSPHPPALALNPHPLHTNFQGHEQDDLHLPSSTSPEEPRVDKAFGDATWLQVSDLQPNTLYSVRLMALNAVGASKPTPKLRFKTDQEPPEGLVTQIEVESNSSQSIIVTWKVTSSTQ